MLENGDMLAVLSFLVENRRLSRTGKARLRTFS